MTFNIIITLKGIRKLFPAYIGPARDFHDNYYVIPHVIVFRHVVTTNQTPPLIYLLVGA
jgi:hypothetical protein